MAVDFKIIFEEGPRTGGETPGASETAEMPAVPPADKVSGPKPARWKGDPGSSEPKKKDDGPTIVEAIKGLGKFTAGQAGMGGVVSTLENLTKHLVNVYQAVIKGTTSGSYKVTGGRSPDTGSGLELKGPKAPPVTGPVSGAIPSVPKGTPVSDIPMGVVPPPVIGPTAAAGTADSLAVSAAPAAEGLAGFTAALGPAAVVVAAVVASLATVAAAAYAVKTAFDALHSEGQRIQGYSPELSQAHAMSGLRAELADMRRANRIGPNAARVEDMRSRVMEKVADIGTEVYAKVAELVVKVEPAIDVLIDVLGLTADSIPNIVDTLIAIHQSMNPLTWKEALSESDSEKRNRQRMQAAVIRFIEGKEAEEEDTDDAFMLQFLNQFAEGKAGLAALGRARLRAGHAAGGLRAKGLPAAATGFGV